MTFRPLAPVPVEPSDDPAGDYRRLAKMVNALSKQVDLIVAQGDALRLQGIEISTTAPADNEVLKYDLASNSYGPEVP